MYTNNKQLFSLIAIGVAVLVIPLAIWGIIAFTQRGTEEVSLHYLPSDATVTINDNDHSGEDTVRLTPGEYTITLEREGFTPDTQQLTVKEGESGTVISTLTPATEEAYAWVEQHQEEYQQLEAIAGSNALENGQALIEEYPLLEHLPLEKAVYTIGYKREGEGIVITVSAVEGYRESAIQAIKDLGYDPGDYRIEFNNYENPFDE